MSKSTKKIAGLGSLRIEAKPFELEELNEKQTDAFLKILRILKAAVESADGVKDTSENSFEDFQFSRLVFLHGDRGTGKTSLLLSLKRYLSVDSCSNITDFSKYNGNDICEDCRRVCDKCRKPGERENMPHDSCRKMCKDCLEICNICQQKANRFIWLETLDMEPLPGPVNLLAAILARIEYAVGQFIEKDPYRARMPNRPSPFEHVPEFRKVIMDMQHLQQDVTLAWEGNLFQQAPNIDPDTYATEVYRAERSRIDLNKRFKKLLMDLSHYIFNTNRYCKPIFILPIDDFDLNPLRCLDLLRLISMVSTPHLFTVILGDIEITRDVFNLEIERELVSVGQRCETQSPASSSRYIAKLANDISANAIRKLIPPSHRVYLKEMIIEDAFGFSLESDNSSIKELMKLIPVRINTAEVKEKKSDESVEKEIYDTDKQFIACDYVGNLAKLFDAKSILHVEEEKGKPNISPYDRKELEKVYCARKLLRIPIRKVQDFWMYLKEVKYSFDHSEKEQEDKIREGIKLARAIFKAYARDDENLTVELTRELIKMVEFDFEGNLQIKTERLHADNIVGPSLWLPMEGRTIVAHLAKDWLIGIVQNQNYKREEKNKSDKNKEILYLNHRTSSAIVFIHDLLALRRPRGIVGKSLVQKIKKKDWAYAKWDLGAAGVVKVPWLAPPWLSFWEHDFLRRGWNDSWMWFRYAESQLYTGGRNASEVSAFLAFVWIKIGTILIKSGKPEKDLFYQFELPKYGEELRRELQIRCDTKPCKVENICKKMKKTIEEDSEEKNWKGFIKIVPRICDWLLLVDKVHELAEMVLNPDRSEDNQNKIPPRRRDLIRGWLARTACMLTPEFGLSPRIAMLFFLFRKEDNNLLKLWMEPDMARKIRTIRAKAAVKFYNKKAFELGTKLFSPQKREIMIKRTKPFQPWPDEETSTEKIKKELELKWPCNYDVRRNALNIVGNKMLCPVLEEIQSLSSLEKKDWDDHITDMEETDYRKESCSDLGILAEEMTQYLRLSLWKKDRINKIINAKYEIGSETVDKLITKTDDKYKIRIAESK